MSFHMTMTQPEVINSYYCGWFYSLLGTRPTSQNLSQRRKGWRPETIVPRKGTLRSA